VVVWTFLLAYGDRTKSRTTQLSVTFKAFMALTILTMFFGLSRLVHWLAETNVSEKQAVSIFKAKVTISALKRCPLLTNPHGYLPPPQKKTPPEHCLLYNCTVFGDI
jgi:hypothetical protein